MHRHLPEGLTPCKRTPEFTGATIPAGLLRDHATAPGVWGKIHVTAGALIYRIDGTAEEELLTPGVVGIVVPGVPHSVEPVGDVLFHVEFWK